MGKISFFLKEAFGSLTRNYFMTIAAFVTVFLSILVLGGVLVFVFTSDALLKEVEEKVEITVYLKNDPDPEPDQISAMQSEIAGWTEVKECIFVSKADALERMKEWFKDNPEVLDSLSGNPLPASFEIALADPQTVDVVAARFADNPIVDEVKYGEEIADKLFLGATTVKTHVQNILIKLGVSDRTQAAVQALRLGLIQ